MINHGIKFWENINLKELGILSPGFYFFLFFTSYAGGGAESWVDHSAYNIFNIIGPWTQTFKNKSGLICDRN